MQFDELPGQRKAQSRALSLGMPRFKRLLKGQEDPLQVLRIQAGPGIGHGNLNVFAGSDAQRGKVLRLGITGLEPSMQSGPHRE